MSADLPSVDLTAASAFVASTKFAVTEATGSRVTGTVDLGPDQHTPWGVVHGGLYCAVIESAASIGASVAVADGGQFAVGVNNNTDFIRSMTEGRLQVVAEPVQQGRTQQLWQVLLTRADVNGLVRRHLGARKVSFAPQDVAVAESGMEYGGITPLGLPPSWPVLVDPAVAATDLVVVGSGTRGGKLAVSGAALAALPAAEVLEGLGRPVAEPPRPAPAAPAERAPDDRDVGWGERPEELSAADRRYLEDRPPHWGSD